MWKLKAEMPPPPTLCIMHYALYIMQATHIRIKRGYVEVEVAKWQSSMIEK